MRTRRPRSRDEGFAMPVVLGLMMALSLVVALAVTLSTESLKASGRDADSHTALDAAQAGVQDYLNRLNIDDGYFNRGNSHPAAAGDPGNPALVADPTSPTDTGWTPVDGTGGEFRYSLLNTPAEVQQGGDIRLRASGRAGGRTRTVDVVLAKGSFLDYLYFSTYETPPPIAAGDPDAAAADCQQFLYAGRPLNTCPAVAFDGNDELDGPVHSQDAMTIRGATTFKDIVTTNYPGENGRFWRVAPNTSPVPRFLKGAPFLKALQLPTRNEALAASAVSSGCVYTGPTQILLHATGKMTVTSPYSARLLLADGCGTFNAPDYTAHVDVPQGRVIMVQGAAAGCDDTLRRLVVRFPVTGDNGYTGTTKLGYNCAQGDLFVEGTMPGRATFYAQNNVVVTGNLLQAGGLSGTGAVGLVADSVVAVYHPVKCTEHLASGHCKPGAGSNVDRAGDTVSTTTASVPTRYPMTNVEIQAAVLALQNGFLVQQHNRGAALQKLTVRGAIAQKFRGAVGAVNGTGAHAAGYLKDYRYDNRLRYAPPPAMADLANTAWEVRQFAEKAG